MLLTKEYKKQLRSMIFRHLDGIVTGPAAYALYEKGILQYLKAQKQSSLAHLTQKFVANEGYLNVALRTLCAQGWLTQEMQDNGQNIIFTVTEKGAIAFDLVPIYKDAVTFIPHAIKMQEFLNTGFDHHAFASLKSLFANYQQKFGIVLSEDTTERAVQEQILKHLEGLIAGPIVVALGISGLFHRYFSVAPFEVEEFSKHHLEVKAIVDFFTDLGWFTKKGKVYNFAPEGMFFARRASAYGVTVSYLPTFMLISELLFGNPKICWERPESSPEIHVNRAMNVWGSGGAHTAYFKKIDEVIIDLFNKPIEEQPKGFLDMGCGNGAFVEHIFNIIWKQTQRGKMLDDYPLFIVGSDYNEAALLATRETLNQADIWAKVVWGDISRPELLAESLQEKYNIFLGDLLNVRSFLDHNRIYELPETIDSNRISNSKGAFAFRGQRIPNNEVEENLVLHLKKWGPYVEKFGLLVIELHTIDPVLIAENLGKTGATAYDATHGYSDQYILEIDCFLKAAQEAGLAPDPTFQTKFPNSDLATVSINLLKNEEYIGKVK